MTQLIRNLEAIINLLFKLNAKYRIRLILNCQILYEVVLYYVWTIPLVWTAEFKH